MTLKETQLKLSTEKKQNSLKKHGNKPGIDLTSQKAIFITSIIFLKISDSTI